MADGEGFNIPAGTVVMETAVDMKGIDRDLKELEKRGKEAGESLSESVGSGAEKASRSTEDLRRGLQASREEADRSTMSLQDWQDTAEGASEAGAGLALVVGRRLVSGLKGAVGWIGKTTAGLLALTGAGLSEAGEGLEQLGRELAESSSKWRHFGVAVEGAGSVLSAVGELATKVASAVTGAQVASVAAAGAFTLFSKRAADDFVASWNDVLTLIPEGVEGLEDLKREVSSLAGDLGVSADVANNTFYQVLSALPELAQEPTQALQVLRAALSATATGFTDGATAAKAITTVMNAFNLEAEDAVMISDALFEAQEQGVLTFQDVASELGKVSGLTSALGVDFRELLAIISTATRVTGASTSEVVTQLRGVLRSFVDPSTQAKEAAKDLGVELSAAAVRSKGLIGAMADLIRETEGAPEAISQLIPEANAQTLVISLAGSVDSLQRSQAAYNDTAGNTSDVLQQTQDDIESQIDLLQSEGMDALRQWGFQWERTGTAVAKVLRIINSELGEGVRLASLLAGSGTFGEFSRLMSGNIMSGPGGGLSRALAERLGLTDREILQALGLAGEAPVPLPQGPAAPVPFPQGPIPEGVPGMTLEARRQAVERARELVNELRQSLGFAVEMADLDLIEISELDRAKRLRDHFEALRKAAQVVGPGAEGFERGPGGMLQVADEDLDRLAQLARFTEELNRQNLTARERLEAVQGEMDRLGLSVEDVKGSTSDLADIVLRELLRALPDWAAEMLGVADNADEASENTRNLADDIQNLAQLAGGVLQLADAFGVFGDEASQALQKGVGAATQLAQGVGSLQEALAQGASGFALAGPIGAIAGGAAGLISGIAGLFGESPEEKRARQRVVQEASELARSLDELRRSAEAVRSVFGEVAGETVSGVQRALAGLSFERPGSFTKHTITEELIGPLRDALAREGVTEDEFISFLQGLPGGSDQFSELIGALEGRFVEMVEAGEAGVDSLIDELEAAQEAAGELDLTRAFEDFEARMGLLRQEFELLDIEDPIDQLERLRDVLTEMDPDLPPALEQILGQADLSTAEGRRQLEAVIETLIEQLAAGELEPGDLGELTLSQFRDLLSQMEGMLEEANSQLAERLEAQGINVQQEIAALRQRWELTDLEDPQAQFEQLAELLLKRGGETSSVQRLLEKIARGGAGADAAIMELFTMLTEGVPGEGLLGELTREEFLAVLGQLESLLDQIRDGEEAGGGAPPDGAIIRGFQEVNSATVAQAGQMVSWLSAMAEQDRVRNELLRRMAGGVRPLGLRSIATVGGDVQSLVQVQVSAPITVNGVEAPADAAAQVSSELEQQLFAAVNRALGQDVSRRERAQGVPSRSTR